MLTDLEACGWRRKVDAVFSIDAMVHVNLQYLTAYLVTAAVTLRAGGKLILTLANVVRPGRLRRSFWATSRHYFPLQDQPNSSFAWVSPQIVRFVLGNLGFEIDLLIEGTSASVLVASLVDVDRAAL